MQVVYAWDELSVHMVLPGCSVALVVLPSHDVGTNNCFCSAESYKASSQVRNEYNNQLKNHCVQVAR